QVKEFAQQTLPTLQDHLKQAQEIQGNLRKVAGTQSPEQQTAPAAGTTSQGTSATQEAARPPSAFAGMTAEQLNGQTVVNQKGDKVGRSTTSFSMRTRRPCWPSFPSAGSSASEQRTSRFPSTSCSPATTRRS